MDVLKLKKTKLIIAYSISVAIGLWLVINLILAGGEAKKADAEFYKNFNESFIGKITKIKHYNHNEQRQGGKKFDFIYIKLIKSTIKNYDIRDASKKGFFIIKNNFAVLIIDSQKTKKMQQGDGILFDGDVDTLYHYKDSYYFNKDYGEYEIIENPYIEATKKLPENAIVFTKWQPGRIIYSPARYSVAKKINDF